MTAWKLPDYSNSKVIRKILKNGRCAKDDAPKVDFPDTLRPNLRKKVQ